MTHICFAELLRHNLYQLSCRRELASRDYDPTVRNPDWFAEQFLGPNERKLLAGDKVIKDLERDYREAIKEPEPSTGMVHIRTRFIDERLQHAVSGGAAQVVILDTGNDSRAYCMKELLKGVRVFEVDYGPTQELQETPRASDFWMLTAQFDLFLD